MRTWSTSPVQARTAIDGVVAEHLGIAIAGSVLGLAAHLADGGVEVDHQLLGSRSGPEGPCPAQRLGEHPVELTDVAEGEGPQGTCPRWRAPSPGDRAPTAVAPDRSMSAWSMWRTPATMACTKVSTLRPGRAPPTRPERWTVALIRRSSPSRDTNVATSSSPALATRLRLVEGHLDAVDSARYFGSLKVPPGSGRNCDFDTAIFPGREALSADARLSTQVAHRCIEAKAWIHRPTTWQDAESDDRHSNDLIDAALSSSVPLGRVRPRVCDSHRVVSAVLRSSAVHRPRMW